MWNKNNFLLWQGQLVSSLGDMVYQLALGFWVLAYTGSTAAMGVVVAAGVLPRGVIGLFSGVFVDRMNRKALIVMMDLIRGLAVLVVAIAALENWLNVPIIITVAILIGLCDSFFDPAVGSSIPSITEKEHLMRINSAFALNRTGSQIIGNALGGLLFATIGAPILFLVNGISYLLSAFTELFISIPAIEHEEKDFNFIKDMKKGFQFIRKSQGMIVLLISVFSLNFLLSMGGILYLPYFESRADLGPEKFGIAMAILSGTSFGGYFLLSIWKLKKGFHFPWFVINVLLFILFRVPMFQFEFYWIICLQYAFIGFSLSQLNSLIDTASQLIVPEHLRGKVFGVLGAMSAGLMPLGLATGGILAEYFPIPLIELVTGTLVAIGFLPSLLNREFRKMVNQDFDPQS